MNNNPSSHLPLFKRVCGVFFNLSYHFTRVFSKSSVFLANLFIPFFPEVFLIEGAEKSSGLPLCAAFAGASHRIKEDWTNLIFEEHFKERSLGRHFFITMQALLRQQYPECALFFAEQNVITKMFSSRLGLSIPESVSMELDLSHPIENLFGREHGVLERSIRQLDLRHEMTTDRQVFENFYHGLYVPSMRRYDMEIDSYRTLDDIFSRGELILVCNQDHDVVCAALCEVQGQKIYCRHLGVGESSDLKMGFAEKVCSFFLVQELKARGYQKIHLGETSPFLSDRKTACMIALKSQVALQQESPCLSMILFKNLPSVQSFLIRRPLISADKDGYRAVFFQAEDQDNESFNDMVKHAVCPGLADSHIFVFRDIAERSNYFFTVKPAWPLFDHPVIFTEPRPVKTRVSWSRKLQRSSAVAGG
jgi:hypothetical protein